MLAFARHYWALLLAAACVGIGSSIFHPDSSRVARTASGGRFGFAQSLFQVGGNTGTAHRPAARRLRRAAARPAERRLVHGCSRSSRMVLLWNVGTWARAQHLPAAPPATPRPPGRCRCRAAG